MKSLSFSDKTLNSNCWNEKALSIHALISVEISRKFNFYTPNQKKVFKVALDLIDQLDAYLELLKELDCFYFNTLKELLQLLKKLNVEQLGITITPLLLCMLTELFLEFVIAAKENALKAVKPGDYVALPQ